MFFFYSKTSRLVEDIEGTIMRNLCFLGCLGSRFLRLPLRLLFVGGFAQSAHLARLNLADLLAADVDASVRIAQLVARNVLFDGGPQLLGLAARQFVQVVRGDFGAAQAEIDRRPDLGQFDARRAHARLFQLDLVRAHQDLVVFGEREAEHMLDALQPNGVDRFAVEQVDEQRLEAAHLLALRPLWPVEHQARFDARADFLVVEVAERFVLLDAQLDHVEQLAVEGAAQHQVVGPLLRRRSEREQRAIVFVHQKLQRTGVLERCDVVVARQRLAQRLLQLLQVLERLLHIAGATTALEQERVLGGFENLRLTRQ